MNEEQMIYDKIVRDSQSLSVLLNGILRTARLRYDHAELPYSDTAITTLIRAIDEQAYLYHLKRLQDELMARPVPEPFD